jgi:hypothetical protein
MNNTEKTKYCGRLECSVNVTPDGSVDCNCLGPEKRCSHSSLPQSYSFSCPPHVEAQQDYIKRLNFNPAESPELITAGLSQ